MAQLGLGECLKSFRRVRDSCPSKTFQVHHTQKRQRLCRNERQGEQRAHLDAVEDEPVQADGAGDEVRANHHHDGPPLEVDAAAVPGRVAHIRAQAVKDLWTHVHMQMSPHRFAI